VFIDHEYHKRIKDQQSDKRFLQLIFIGRKNSWNILSYKRNQEKAVNNCRCYIPSGQEQKRKQEDKKDNRQTKYP